jgi:D-alanine-D-alanine ligase
VTQDLPATIGALAAARPDAVFNALHGRFGEDGCIQGVLDWMGLPYTHSGVRASAVAMDKAAAKAVFRAHALPVAEHRVVSPEELAEADPLPLPYVVKPVDEGSSVGVTILREGDNRRREIARAWPHGPRIMAESYIPGRELTVAVMGDRALAVTEIATGTSSTTTTRNTPRAAAAICCPPRCRRPSPPRPSASRSPPTRRWAAAACPARTSATTTRMGNPGRLVLLEVNTQPGMTPTSLLPEQAAHLGIPFPALCRWIVEQARHGA